MATLTLNTLTRSTGIVAASRPRLTMPLSRALEMIMVAGEQGYAIQQALRLQINDRRSVHQSISIDDAAVLASRKPCGAVDDLGAGMSSKGAFVTSLGSRPPSPPVL